MRDKIVFFILGAVLATIAYLIGDLETLTAENKVTELDPLYLNNLVVKDHIRVGGLGKKSIVIGIENEIAHISLFGATLPAEESDFINAMTESPILRLTADGNAALITAKSQSKRPEAKTILGVASLKGKYFSSLTIQDLDGLKNVYSD